MKRDEYSVAGETRMGKGQIVVVGTSGTSSNLLFETDQLGMLCGRFFMAAMPKESKMRVSLSLDFSAISVRGFSKESLGKGKPWPWLGKRWLNRTIHGTGADLVNDRREWFSSVRMKLKTEL